jgi:hypothetical protein
MKHAIEGKVHLHPLGMLTGPFVKQFMAKVQEKLQQKVEVKKCVCNLSNRCCDWTGYTDFRLH